jgi:hypothetical protein
MDFEKNGHGKLWKSHGILNGRRRTNPDSKCIRTFEAGRGLTSYFLRGCMDVFWNDPNSRVLIFKIFQGAYPWIP